MKKKTEDPLGEMDQYEDQPKDILNSILKEELSDSDSGVLIEELQLYEQTRFCYWNKGAVKQRCKMVRFKLTSLTKIKMR